MLFDSFGFQDALHYGDKLTLVVFLLIILVGGMKKKWVFGWQYRDAMERLEKIEESNTMWMQLALRGLNVTQQVVEKAVANDTPAE